MGAVQDDEFCHHLWVVNGKQPCYGPTPVVANKATSVVSLEDKQINKRQSFVIVAEDNILLFLI